MDDVGDDPDESPFAFVDHDATREVIEGYRTQLADRRGRATSTVSTRRSILRQYLVTYERVNEPTDYRTTASGGNEDDEDRRR